MPKFDLNQIKAKNSIIEVAREFGYNVDNYRMRCFQYKNHSKTDSDASLFFNIEKNSFWCPVCRDVRGDVIKFVMISRDINFYSAVTFLADRAGINPEDGDSSGKKRNIEQAINFSADPKEFADVDQFFFDNCSEPTEDAKKWLKSKGISQETIDSLSIRYVRRQRELIEALLTNFPKEKLIKSGLINDKELPFWRRHKLIWTFFFDQKPIYFQGYSINSLARPREMCIARQIPYPFNVDILKARPKTVFVCSNILDVATLEERGIPAIGVSGVNGFKNSWINLLYGIQVKIAFRADVTGQAKAVELVQRLRCNQIDAEKIYLPNNYDVTGFFGTLNQFQL